MREVSKAHTIHTIERNLNPMLTLLLTLIAPIALLVMFQIRNEMVYRFRMKTLDESDWIDRQLVPYNQLPPY